MISWLRNFNVTTRILSLACFLVMVMVAQLAFFMYGLDNLQQRSEMQLLKVAEQRQLIEKEAEQFVLRAKVQKLQQQAQQVQKTFSDMLFWYFDGIVTEYYESLIKATDSANLLQQQLSALSSDPNASAQVQEILDTLTEYREIMDSAVGYYQQGKDNLAESEIGDANLEAKNLNEQILALANIFQARLSQADTELVKALDETLTASKIVEQLSMQASSQVDEDKNILWLILLLTLAVTIVVASAVIISITRPLSVLKNQLLAIEQNSDLTQMLSVDGRDEIRDMSEATQNLLLKLRSTLDQVGILANELNEAAKKGYAVSLDTLKQSTEQQLQSAGIAAAATELGASSEDISKTADQGLLLVKEVSKAASEGQVDVQATAKTMHQLSEQFDGVESSVSELVQHSSAIGQVLDVIRGIADQTNLLALNAAIEAARAGDQGRGFAVVADEVRTLAQRTSQSTDEIQKMVEALQKHSQVASSSLESNRKHVDNSVKLSEQAETSLVRIIEELVELESTNQVIASITTEQQNAVIEVDENVQKIRTLACNVEEQAKDSSSVSESLTDMANKLQNELKVFRR
ncbi:MAG: methyl-accepting chemotaxis protein [Pseudomonadales bacterium]|nr:methyl-accepting chemotaxis protein [Pseudomonadales bacterium]NRA14113.1 methyl-accepting chemotaxis protein [Oceanospirillaceae bacterium]